MASGKRPDRIGEHRTAFERNRKIILSTQNVCGICGKEIDPSFKYPHPLSATVDHIVPVAKGGHPSALSNLQAAHRWCNMWKKDKLMEGLRLQDKADLTKIKIKKATSHSTMTGKTTDQIKLRRQRNRKERRPGRNRGMTPHGHPLAQQNPPHCTYFRAPIFKKSEK